MLAKEIKDNLTSMLDQLNFEKEIEKDVESDIPKIAEIEIEK